MVADLLRLVRETRIPAEPLLFLTVRPDRNLMAETYGAGQPLGAARRELSGVAAVRYRHTAVSPAPTFACKWGCVSASGHSQITPGFQKSCGDLKLLPGEFGDHGFHELSGGGAGGGELRFQLVHQCHELIDFGDDAALFGERWNWNWIGFQLAPVLVRVKHLPKSLFADSSEPNPCPGFRRLESLIFLSDCPSFQINARIAKGH